MYAGNGRCGHRSLETSNLSSRIVVKMVEVDLCLKIPDTIYLTIAEFNLFGVDDRGGTIS